MKFFGSLKKRYDLHMAVKEALDSLPTAVCYFSGSGTVKLCNTAMYDIFRKIAQSELQSLGELRAALEDCDRRTSIIRDGNVFLFPDGRAWLYSDREIVTEDKRVYTEAVFSDVTELNEKRRELEGQSKELKTMYRELKTLSDNILEATREQEILNMKSRLHDQMNMGVAAIRQIFRQDITSEENAAAVARFRRAIRVLQEETSTPGDDMSEFIRDAEVSGIRVTLDGVLPMQWDNALSALILTVFREACVNAARHADARNLYISSGSAGQFMTFRIRNDGKAPEGTIQPRGGLADLEKKITGAGGSMAICSAPEFELTVTLPMQQEKQEVSE